MHYRLASDARLVMSRACDEAMRLNHDELRCEHVLLGLLSDRHINDLLFRLGMTNADVRLAVERTVERGPRLVIDDVEVETEEMLDLFDAACEEADGFGHEKLRGPHLLLGILKVPDSEVAGVLEEIGVSLDGARHEVLEFLIEQDERTCVA